MIWFGGGGSNPRHLDLLGWKDCYLLFFFNICRPRLECAWASLWLQMNTACNGVISTWNREKHIGFGWLCFELRSLQETQTEKKISPHKPKEKEWFTWASSSWTCTVGWVAPCPTSHSFVLVVLGKYSALLLVVPGSFTCSGASFTRIREYNHLLQRWSSFSEFHFPLSMSLFSFCCSVLRGSWKLDSGPTQSCSRNTLALPWHCWCLRETMAFVSKLSHKPSLENSEIKLLQIDANLRRPYIPQNNK